MTARMLEKPPALLGQMVVHPAVLAQMKRDWPGGFCAHDWSPAHLDPNRPGRVMIRECLSCGDKKRAR